MLIRACLHLQGRLRPWLGWSEVQYLAGGWRLRWLGCSWSRLQLLVQALQDLQSI